MCDNIMDHEKRINPDYSRHLCCINGGCDECTYDIYGRIFMVVLTLGLLLFGYFNKK